MAPRDWEVYGGASSKRYLHPRVTITRYPRIHLNRGSYDLLGGPSKVVLLYDKAHRAIGIRAVTDESQPGHRVEQRTVAGTAYAVMGSQHFLRHYGFTGDETIEFSAVVMEDDTMVLSLDEARQKGRVPFRASSRDDPAIDGSARAGWRQFGERQYPPLDDASGDETI